MLKRTFGPKLPLSIVKAPKMPFSVPLREWFVQDQFERRLKDLASADFGLDCGVMHNLVNASRSGREDYGDFIWRLFVLKHWHDKRG